MLLVGFSSPPLFAGDYVLTVLILILYFAYTGQAWNIMMGFAGQLSLGHALYVGLGAYTAAALYVHFGIGPWIGLLVAVPVAALAGAFIGFLAFRFRVAGVYFAILTIALPNSRGSGLTTSAGPMPPSGLFLPVAQYAHNDLWQLRGHPVMFYYVLLAAIVLAFILCSRLLLKSRIGYFWLAIREDEEAARSAGIDTFHYKMIAVVISAAMTSFAGVDFRVLLQQPVSRAGVQHFPVDSTSSSGRSSAASARCSGHSLESFVLEIVAEGLRTLLEWFDIDLPGSNQMVFGLMLLLVVIAMPDGVWPWLARRFGLSERKNEPRS